MAPATTSTEDDYEGFSPMVMMMKEEKGIRRRRKENCLKCKDKVKLIVLQHLQNRAVTLEQSSLISSMHPKQENPILTEEKIL